MGVIQKYLFCITPLSIKQLVNIMKTSVKILVLFLLNATLFSCSQKNKYQYETSIERESFGTTQFLTGSNMQFDDIIMRPNRLLVCDSLLIMTNTGGKKLFDIFNLKSKKKVGERISVGQGPNEMIQSRFVYNDEKTIVLFDMVKSTVFEFLLDDFVHNLNPTPFRKIKLDGKMLDNVGRLGNQIVGSTYNPNFLFFNFDMLGNKKGQMGKYPVSEINFSDSEKLKAYQFSLATNHVDKIVICYNWADLIDIYNINGELYKRIVGPQHFTSVFKEFHDGNVISARSVQGKQRDAYFNPVSVGDEFFVLFSGKSMDKEGYTILSDQILVFSWDGEPQKKLSLDQGIFAFTVDDKNNKIYGISDTPEYHIVEFEYQ